MKIPTWRSQNKQPQKKQKKSLPNASKKNEKKKTKEIPTWEDARWDPKHSGPAQRQMGINPTWTPPRKTTKKTQEILT